MTIDNFKVRVIFYFLFCVLFYFILSLSTGYANSSRYTMEPIPDNVAVTSTLLPDFNLSSTITDKERHCLILTLLGEATANHREEVIEISRLILRRKSDRYGSDVCQVVLAYKQFSMWNNRSMASFRYDPDRYQMYSEWVDEALLKGPMTHNHYWHPNTMKQLYGRYNPYWSKSCLTRESIGYATFCTIDLAASRLASTNGGRWTKSIQHGKKKYKRRSQYAKSNHNNKRLSKNNRRRYARL